MEEVQIKIAIAICLFSLAAISAVAIPIIRKRMKQKQERIAQEQELRKQELNHVEKVEHSLTLSQKSLVTIAAVVAGGALIYLLYKRYKNRR